MKHDPDESLGRWVHIIDRCQSRFAHQRLGSYGIGKGHLFILASLMHEGDDVPQETLSRRLHLERGATARSLASLESKGYVRRAVDPEDARARRVRVTAKARRLWPKILEESAAWNRILTRAFTASERKQATTLLKNMARNAMDHLDRDLASATRSRRPKKLAVLAILVVLFGAAVGTAHAGDPSLVEVRAPAAAATDASTGTPAPASSASPPEMDVATVLRLAGERSLAAQLARDDSLGAEAAIDEAQAAWWPTITADASYTVKDNPVVAVFGDARFPFAEKNSAAYGIQAKQLLFDGGQRRLAIEAARQQAKTIHASSRAGIREAQLQALDTYLQILRLNGRASVLKQRQSAVIAHRKVVEGLYEQGMVARNDLLETQVREREIDDAQNALRDARETATADLNRLLGRKVDTPAAFPDSLGAPPPLPETLDVFFVQADTLNPGLRAAQSQVEAARIRARLAKRAYWPEFYVALGHTYEENQYMAYPNVNAVVAGMNWKVFEGGARRAKIQQAQAKIASAEKSYEDGRRTVRVAVDSAWRRWRQSLREEDTARRNVAAARANLQIVEDQYRSGLARSSDVLDAETLLAQSRFDVINRHYESYWNQARLLATAGSDPAEFYANAHLRGEQ